MASPAAGFAFNVALPAVKIRNELGRYTSAQTQLHSQMREQIVNQQGLLVARMRGSMKRPTVSTGRLLRVTADPKNIIATRTAEDQYTIGLGNVDFLDNSMAKYWRTIEEGSAATWTKRSFTSLPLQGLWSHTLGPYRTGPSGPWVTATKPYNTDPDAMYQPFRRGRGGGPSKLPVFHPSHDIEPMDAYRRIAESPEFRRSFLYENQQLMEAILTLGFGHNPRGDDGGTFYGGF